MCTRTLLKSGLSQVSHDSTRDSRSCVLAHRLGPLLPLIIGPKVPSYYVLVEQQSNTLPSVCVSVNHIHSPPLLFQMAPIIALFLLQMFYGAIPQHSQALG